MYGRGEHGCAACLGNRADPSLALRGAGAPGFVPSSGGGGGGGGGYGPRSGGPPPGYGSPMRQDSGYGARAHGHAGLGAQGAAPNLPRPANLPPTPAYGGGSGSPLSAGGGGGGAGMGEGGERYSLFVGSIVDGLENGWLEKILAVSSQSWRRSTGS